jgi:hypothetical protein
MFTISLPKQITEQKKRQSRRYLAGIAMPKHRANEHTLRTGARAQQQAECAKVYDITCSGK